MRRLKRKEEERQPHVERELSDAYIDGISRTPRYEYGRHNTYDDMISEMNPEDPFKGQYTPSGKLPKERTTLPKPKRKSKKVRSAEDDAIPLDSTTSKKKSKRKKRQKGEESAESTGTFTVEAHVNAGYEATPSGQQLDTKQTEFDQASVKSNGTYTLGDSKTSAGLKALSKPFTRKSPKKVKSMTQELKHSSKNDEIDTVSQLHNLQMHNCLYQVPDV